jgi:hypothetical protein
MNMFSVEEKTRVIIALVECNSIRSICRMTGIAKGTVIRLLVSVDKACAAYQDKTLRNLTCSRTEFDKI